MTFPEKYQKDIETIISILRGEGCEAIYIFGSLAEGNSPHRETDIDIAVKGLPESRFFDVYGRILTSTSHSVDLIDIDRETPFTRVLQEKEIWSVFPDTVYKSNIGDR